MYNIVLSLIILAVLNQSMLGTGNQGTTEDINIDSQNDSEIVKGTTSNQTIVNQYVVVLQNNTTDNATELLINELENRGAVIIGRYDELFKGFSFKTKDNQTAEKIVDFLEKNSLVQSLTQDREAAIHPE